MLLLAILLTHFYKFNDDINTVGISYLHKPTCMEWYYINDYER